MFTSSIFASMSEVLLSRTRSSSSVSFFSASALTSGEILAAFSGQRLASTEHNLIRAVLELDFFLDSLVLIGELFRLVLHPLDLVILQFCRILNGNVLFLASSLVLGSDVHDTVCVDVVADLNLWFTAASGSNSVEG